MLGSGGGLPQMCTQRLGDDNRAGAAASQVERVRPELQLRKRPHDVERTIDYGARGSDE